MASVVPKHDFPRQRHRVAVGVIILFSVCSFIFFVWYRGIHPFQQHRETYKRLQAAISDLRNRRPPDVTREEWSFVVGWTSNGIGNCCALPEYLTDGDESHQRFVEFVDELERKIQRNVTIETVDWIWDQFMLVSRYGERYSRNWRPTTEDRLKESAYVSTGIEVN